MGATLQILVKLFLPRIWPVRVRVDILQPFAGRELAVPRGAQASASAVTSAIIERVA